MDDHKYLLQDFLRNQILDYRHQNHMTQEGMAEALHVSPRSYFDQEHGRYGFSAMSLVFFILLLSEEDLLKFFKNLRFILEGSEPDALHCQYPPVTFHAGHNP
ncbi:MAG TPA: helix-turn-helix domain-containing protein [Candidatus Anaerostipes avistercoris]|uniref:Helix-turn-helix domain-containing protein n=1 Tax=Candidatus Anaerostipes avistercoris TaxID=2838462 RepID=A0A9D2T8H7_9FIRM|nr:helix-turn-helix domain-containing protein [Candidatus Anaerostipes avistercoris]